ncbi:MAG: Zn-ribbon domain-containing OB-fold protein [Candidatus Rokubacteria bacterium]|nr:Zn-ribbon domain-containing OB-fold protein [Candidatus Rokubacteria bacterium]
MSDYGKPLPRPSTATRPFWDGCREGELRLPWCRACGRPHFFPRSLCPHCLATDLEWRRASGRGVVWSFSTVRLSFWGKAFDDAVPYVVAMVELEEGVRVLSNVVGCAPGAVRIGLPVEVTFDAVTPEFTLPRFRPA